MRRNGRVAGFTLLEVIIALAIIGILASLAVPWFLHSLEKADRTRIIADMSAIGKGWTSYVIDSGRTFGDIDHRDNIVASHFPEVLLEAIVGSDIDGARPYRFGVCEHFYLLQCGGSEKIDNYEEDCSGRDSRLERSVAGDVPLTRVIVVSP